MRSIALRTAFERTRPNLPMEIINYHKMIWMFEVGEYNLSELPDWFIKFLATNENRSLKENLATNPDLSSKYLKILIEEEGDYRVREAVANHKNTPVELLWILANDRTFTVREAVAYNQNTPIGILEKLSEDSHPLVRFVVANNPNFPKDLKDKFSKDKELEEIGYKS